MTFIEKEFEKLKENGYIDNALYDTYEVKRGLRNANGTGVLVGLTKISDVHGYKMENGFKMPDEGHLYYRDIDLYDLAIKDVDVFGYEKTIFLLLFSHLPNDEEFKEFTKLLYENCELPKNFTDTVILKNPSNSIMNNIQKSILSLYSFDENPDSQDPMELLKKGISLIAKMPSIISYSYQAKRHYIDNESLHIHYVDKDKSIAETILRLIRDDSSYTELEADTLDTALIVHADHGGANNSTFTNIVVASTSTDIYSDITAGLGSLKGPRHGGASIMVAEMMDAMIKEIGVNASEEEIGRLIDRMINKDFFDKTGLLYGIGHAVYTLSDPRCVLLKSKVKELSKFMNSTKYEFYEKYEKIACEKLSKLHGKPYCANVDLYSGLTYELLGIPKDLYTPLFATARISGWVAHIIETNLYCNKIIRPASKYVGKIGQ